MSETPKERYPRTHKPFYGDVIEWNDEDGYAALPELCYLHTLEQIKSMIATTPKFEKEQMFRVGVDDVARAHRSQLQVINIGTADDPHWRVDHKELKRWMRYHKIPAYQF